MIFGVPPWRLAIYTAATAALIAANLWRWGDVAAPRPPQEAPAALNALPDLALTSPSFDRPPVRDLFRKPGIEAAAPPPPPPPPPPRLTPEVDELALEIALANEILDGYRVVGILRVGADMVATLERGGLTVTVKEGDALPEGFTAREVAINHIVLEHEELGVERRFQQGVLDGE